VGEKAESDPEKLELLNQRLARLQALLKKHQVSDAASLLLVQQELEGKLLQSTRGAEQLNALEKVRDKAFDTCKNYAKMLHDSREKAGIKLCEETARLLQGLEMPHTRLKVELLFDVENCTKNGADKLTLLFSANPGKDMVPLQKSASGGELSRVNFCFKTLLAGKKAMPTLIFDEADTGVSGVVAAKMGAMMHKLSSQHQVISITHLPQVAAAGNTHFFVYKNINEKGASTEIKKLKADERVDAIAQMLSGKEPGEAALANARELLGR
jgi:DNA repair protein RecN (Recombination protein N)